MVAFSLYFLFPVVMNDVEGNPAQDKGTREARWPIQGQRSGGIKRPAGRCMMPPLCTPTRHYLRGGLAMAGAVAARASRLRVSDYGAFFRMVSKTYSYGVYACLIKLPTSIDEIWEKKS